MAETKPSDALTEKKLKRKNKFLWPLSISGSAIMVLIVSAVLGLFENPWVAVSVLVVLGLAVAVPYLDKANVINGKEFNWNWYVAPVAIGVLFWIMALLVIWQQGYWIFIIAALILGILFSLQQGKKSNVLKRRLAWQGFIVLAVAFLIFFKVPVWGPLTNLAARIFHSDSKENTVATTPVKKDSATVDLSEDTDQQKMNDRATATQPTAEPTSPNTTTSVVDTTDLEAAVKDKEDRLAKIKERRKSAPSNCNDCLMKRLIAVDKELKYFETHPVSDCGNTRSKPGTTKPSVRKEVRYTGPGRPLIQHI